MMEKFKIECSKMTTDKWGHILACNMKVEYSNTALEAYNRALELSKKLPKHDINVVSPKDNEGDSYCIWGFKKGKVIFTNSLYY